MLASLTASIKAAAKEVKDATVQAYSDATARPTIVNCSECEIPLAVPPTAFDWKCDASHNNAPDDKLCKTCNRPKPNTFEPKIRCASCNAITVVPNTNAEKAVRDTGVAAKKQYVYWKSRPTEFNCDNCNNKLAVPKGAWACQTCTFINQEEFDKCAQCNQAWTDQKVMCGVCNRSTSVPSINLFNDVAKHSREVVSSASKSYYDISGSAYVQCPRCKHSIALPEPPAQAPPSPLPSPSASSASSASFASSASSGPAPAAPSAASSAAAPSSPAPSAPAEPGLDQKAPGADGAPISHSINCPKCALPLSYQHPVKVPSSAQQPAGRARGPSADGAIQSSVVL